MIRGHCIITSISFTDYIQGMMYQALSYRRIFRLLEWCTISSLYSVYMYAFCAFSYQLSFSGSDVFNVLNLCIFVVPLTCFGILCEYFQLLNISSKSPSMVNLAVNTAIGRRQYSDLPGPGSDGSVKLP